MVEPRRFVVVATHRGPSPVGTTIDVPADDGMGPPPLLTAFGVDSSAAVPISVENRLWGALAVVTDGRRSPAGIESRLEQFADLLAAGLANTQAGEKTQRLADQQAALRHVAELAAHDAPPSDVLAAVAAGASDLTGVAYTMVLRFEPDGASEIVALNSAPEAFTVGMRAPETGDGAVHRVCGGRVGRRGSTIWRR